MPIKTESFLKTASIKRPVQENDGIRISVMSRHTLTDGVTPDPDITEASFDLWWPELAPPPRLIGSYYRYELSWEDFEDGFRRHLETPEAQQFLRWLIALAERTTVTILCVEATPERCHRRLIAEACRKMEPSLRIIIA